MIILDENIPYSQALAIGDAGWRFKQVAVDFSQAGTSDEDLIRELMQESRPTFVTMDEDFLQSSLCHSRYCIVYLDLSDDLIAQFISSLLKHDRFDTKAKRMGLVIHVTVTQIAILSRNQPTEKLAW